MGSLNQLARVVWDKTQLKVKFSVYQTGLNQSQMGKNPKPVRGTKIM